MSLRVAILCEDHVLDQYVIKPVIERALAECGRPKAQVRAVTSPRVRGFDDLMKQLCALVERYGEIADIIVVVVDVDCEDGERKPRNKPLAVRNAIGECPKHKEKVVVVMAIQELETWALWGERASLGVPWGTVLEECDPKEVYFEPLLTPVDRESADRGRKRLIAKTLAGGWQSFRSGCSEIADLEDQIRELL